MRGPSLPLSLCFSLSLSSFFFLFALLLGHFCYSIHLTRTYYITAITEWGPSMHKTFLRPDLRRGSGVAGGSETVLPLRRLAGPVYLKFQSQIRVSDHLGGREAFGSIPCLVCIGFGSFFFCHCFLAHEQPTDGDLVCAMYYILSPGTYCPRCGGRPVIRTGRPFRPAHAASISTSFTGRTFGALLPLASSRRAGGKTPSCSVRSRCPVTRNGQRDGRPSPRHGRAAGAPASRAGERLVRMWALRSERKEEHMLAPMPGATKRCPPGRGRAHGHELRSGAGRALRGQAAWVRVLRVRGQRAVRRLRNERPPPGGPRAGCRRRADA